MNKPMNDQNQIKLITIKSAFVTETGLMETIRRVSDNFKRSVIIEPPDLDGFFKVKVLEEAK